MLTAPFLFAVAPAELEGHLLDHPDIADVCVVAAPDEYSGELPFAFVSLHEHVRQKIRADPVEAARASESIMKVSTSLHHLPSKPCTDAGALQWVSDHKTQFKWLAGVEFIDVVPKNPSGKLLRRLLRDQLKQLLAQGKVKLIRPGSKKGQVKL